MDLKLKGWLAPVVVIALIAAIVVGNRLLHPPAVPMQTLACPDVHAGCPFQLGNAAYRVGIDGRLKVLSPFEVWVEGPGMSTVQASFTMEGMDMGFNLYTLRPDPAGVFRVRITLPVCVSGRRDWTLTLDIDGRKIALPFVTEL